MRPLLFCFVALLIFAAPIAGNTDVLADQKETLTRIGYAGELRVMTERIAKSACYVMTGTHIDENAADALVASDMFERLLMALTVGDATKELPEERHTEILQSLQKLTEIWASYGPAGRQISAGDLQTFVLRQVIEGGPMILEELRVLAEQVEGIYREKLVTKREMTRTIDIAAEQAMLSMQMGKQYCFLALDVGRADMIMALRGSMDIFATAMKAMANGDYDMGVVDPPNLAALVLMQEIAEIWKEATAILNAGIEAPDQAQDALPELDHLMVQLRELSEKMLQIYLG